MARKGFSKEGSEGLVMRPGCVCCEVEGWSEFVKGGALEGSSTCVNWLPGAPYNSGGEGVVDIGGGGSAIVSQGAMRAGEARLECEEVLRRAMIWCGAIS